MKLPLIKEGKEKKKYEGQEASCLKQLLHEAWSVHCVAVICHHHVRRFAQRKRIPGR